MHNVKKTKNRYATGHRNTRQTGQYYNTYLLRIDIAQGFPAIINAQQRFLYFSRAKSQANQELRSYQRTGC
jgi:hypothetical protein